MQVFLEVDQRAFPHTVGQQRSKVQTLADINRMSSMSPEDATELAKSVGLRTKQSRLLDLAFDPFRCVCTLCMQQLMLHNYN